MTSAHLPPVVELRDISFSFARSTEPPLEVLDCFSLVVRPGEIIGLVGPSGCGKTTLLRIVAGLLVPTSGTVLVGGMSVTGPTRRCGYVPQAYSLFPWQTVRGNIEYGMRFVDSMKLKMREASSELLRVTGLEEFADEYPKALSGGMKQRVAIARALAAEPDILLLDEPFGALDTQTKAEVQQYFLGVMQQSPKAVLFVTHDVEEAIFLSDTIAILGARPTSVRRSDRVPFARPRPFWLRTSDEFLAFQGTISVELLRGALDPTRAPAYP